MEYWCLKFNKVEFKEGEEVFFVGEDESIWWDEIFGGNIDLKFCGLESVVMDIFF